MMNKIKHKINGYVDGKLQKQYKKQRTVDQIAFNYVLLNQLFADTSFYLPLTTWSMSPSTITHVLNDIVVNERKGIIEFGSGASTLFIAKLLKTNNIKASFFSVESNLEWSKQVEKQLNILELTSYVTMINAPINSVDSSLALGKQKLWYDVGVLNQNLKSEYAIDLVLVDGPFGGLTCNSRFSAIPYLKDKLSLNYTIFLDDIDRNDELNILEEWCKILQCSHENIERYAILSNQTKFFSKPFQL